MSDQSNAQLDEWPENDYRIFCGDLGNEVTDDLLSSAFRGYPSFQKAKVIRDKRTGKTKGTYKVIFLISKYSDPCGYITIQNIVPNCYSCIRKLYRFGDFKTKGSG